MVTTFTAGLGALTVFVEDSGTGRFKDFLVSPIRRWQLVLGYLLSSFSVAVIMSVLVLIVGQIYLKLSGYNTLDRTQLLEVLGLIILFSAVFSSISSFFISFIKTSGAFSSLSTIIGTLIGFFAAIYVPIGRLPSGVASFLNYLPFAQTAALMRQPYTTKYVANLSHGNIAIQNTLNTTYGNNIEFGARSLKITEMVIYLVVIAIIFFGLSAFRIGKRIN